MSGLLSDLMGRRCCVRTEDEEYLTGSPDIPCRVTGADGEWLRVAYIDEQGNRVSRISRIDMLLDVLVFEE
jgi:hypothetical protein